MTFDTPIDSRGTGSFKWDAMPGATGVAAQDGLAMWVADMDFRPPKCVSDAVLAMHTHGVYGYYGGDGLYASSHAYLDAIRWWMETRHGWSVAREEIFVTNGVVNGVAACVETFSAPGDGVVLFTPVYHAFARVLKAAGRGVVECKLVDQNGRYGFDFEAYDAQMTGTETMVILCSPHNPGGRVWSRGELQAVAAFAKRHDLILVSDEIHHDLVMPGHVHVPMTAIDGILDRLVMLTAPTKTFNIAGAHIGNVIIPDPDLRAAFAARLDGLGISGNAFGLHMATAAYSPEGAAWVDDLTHYLDGNRQIFDTGIAAIPGVRSMPLEGTYLAWVDFAGTGMNAAEFTARIERDARIAASHGPTFGSGGETFLRLNIATPRSRIAEAVERLQRAFADLQ